MAFKEAELVWLSPATLRAFPRAGPNCDQVSITRLVQGEKEDPGQYWLNGDFLMGGRENGCGIERAPEKVQGVRVLLLILWVPKAVSAPLWVPLSPSES